MYTLTDTVGIVRHLPYDLVEVFRSTLEESVQADLLLHVVDGSDPDPLGQINAVHVVLQDIDASSVPEVIVVNKVDAMDEEAILTLRQALPGAVWVSARTGAGMDELAGVPLYAQPFSLTVPTAARAAAALLMCHV